MARRKRRRHRLGTARKIVSALTAILACCVALAAFVVEYYGGQGAVPTWKELYDRFNIQSSTPDAEVVASGDTSVSFLDVGQGDAVLICQDGEFCLIDAGTSDSQEQLLRSLEGAGVERLKYVVMTHPHADHIGGMEAVLEAFPTDTLILPDLDGLEDQSAMLERTLQAAEDYGIAQVQAATGETYLLGRGSWKYSLPLHRRKRGTISTIFPSVCGLRLAPSALWTPAMRRRMWKNSSYSAIGMDWMSICSRQDIMVPILPIPRNFSPSSTRKSWWQVADWTMIMVIRMPKWWIGWNVWAYGVLPY